MNAGAYGGEMSKIIVSATTCDRKGDLITYDSRDIRYPTDTAFSWKMGK